jgi:FPC/CPF motif-containing protein YcgG
LGISYEFNSSETWVETLSGKTIRNLEHKLLCDKYKSWVETSHPCAGAKNAFKNKTYHIGIYSRFNDDNDQNELLKDIKHYLQEKPKWGTDFGTFIAIFKDEPNVATAKMYVDKLFTFLEQIQQKNLMDFPISDKDLTKLKQLPSLNLSLFGHHFFPMGQHPNSERQARAFENHAIVFNLNSQFESLKQKGLFDRLVRAIRKSDAKYDPTNIPNPNATSEFSNVFQWSGHSSVKLLGLPETATDEDLIKHVESETNCPYHRVLNWFKKDKN